ncbi:hypothetical protein F4009_22205 [Candidatus Poribacteria bacterium]|nr:hypothetical protein [Candidatus Poribacteria bacterium]MYH82533.1 hypothetical protein [Candidatus Poribacteria bacterium]MYK96673.1 hypothetical protein [Candidatus Poribacteria bacterium]
MFANILKNRLFIGALAFFVLCVAGSLLYMRHVEQQTARELAEAEERVQQWNEKQNQQPPAETAVGEKPDQPQQDGHSHADGTFHVGPHEPPTPVESPAVVPPKSEVSAPVGSGARRFHDPYFRMMNGFAITSEFVIAIAPSGVGPDFASMSDEELANAIETINSHTGFPPGDLWPPDGYHYARGGTTVLSDGDNIWLDDNGHPILTKNDAPFFEIAWSEGFRPPPDVYADYKALHERYIQAFLNTPDDSNTSPEVERLSAEKDALEQMYRGRVPSGFWDSGSVPPGMQPHTYFAQFNWARNQMQRSAFEKAGIDYLMDRYSDLKKYANLDRYPELKEFAK